MKRLERLAKLGIIDADFPTSRTTTTTTSQTDLGRIDDPVLVGTTEDGRNIYEIEFEGNKYQVPVGDDVNVTLDNGKTVTFSTSELTDLGFDFDLTAGAGQTTGYSGMDEFYEETTPGALSPEDYQQGLYDNLENIYKAIEAGDLSKEDLGNLTLNLSGGSSARPMTGRARTKGELNKAMYNMIQRNPDLEGKIGFQDADGNLVVYKPGATQEENNELDAFINSTHSNATLPSDMGNTYLNGELGETVNEDLNSLYETDRDGAFSDYGNLALSINRTESVGGDLDNTIAKLNEQYGLDIKADDFQLNRTLNVATTAAEEVELLGLDVDKYTSGDYSELEEKFNLDPGSITSEDQANRLLLDAAQNARISGSAIDEITYLQGQVESEDIVEDEEYQRDMGVGPGMMYLRTPQRLGPDPMMTGPFIMPEFDRVSPIKVSPQSGYQANTKQVGAMMDLLTQQVGAQTGANIANILGQSDESINKLMTATNQQNAQYKMQADRMNAQIQQSEAVNRANALSTYGKEATEAYANTLADRRTYLDTLDADRLARDKEIRSLNILSSIYPSYTFDALGNVLLDPNYNDQLASIPENVLQYLLATGQLDAYQQQQADAGTTASTTGETTNTTTTV